MTFKEFREGPEFKSRSFFVVTTEQGEALVLQWEPSPTFKWYKPKPFWGREEYGYLDSVGLNSRISHIRTLNQVCIK